MSRSARSECLALLPVLLLVCACASHGDSLAELPVVTDPADVADCTRKGLLTLPASTDASGREGASSTADELGTLSPQARQQARSLDANVLLWRRPPSSAGPASLEAFGCPAPVLKRLQHLAR